MPCISEVLRQTINRMFIRLPVNCFIKAFIFQYTFKLNFSQNRNFQLMKYLEIFKMQQI